VDIGLSGDDAAPRLEVATEAEMAALLPERDPRAHKGSAGRAVLVGASAGLTGAMALAARAATRAGAGYVQCCVPASLHDVLATKLTEEMPIPCAQTPARALSLEAMGQVVAAVEKADAVVLGSGLSREQPAAELARRLVSSRTRPMVLDADGLNAFEGRPTFGGDRSRPLVLTPHLGEMSRLTGRTAAALESARVETAIEFAGQWNAVVVLKGAPTVIAAPDGAATVNPTGNPGLATAGTGDVLSGIIGALLAQKLAPYDAARLGAYVHGAAGDRVAALRGVLGMSAGDLLEALPEALLALARVRDRGLGRRATRP
jgi:NAD(P)H-hydrate epimerase